MNRIIARSLSFVVIAVFFAAAFCAPSHASVPRVERMILSNGLVVLFSEEHSLPFAVFDLVLRGGSRSDPKGREGLASITSKSLLLGTRSMSANQLNEKLDALGAAFGVSAGEDITSVNVHVLKKNMVPALSLLFGAVMAPTFPDREIRSEIGRALGAIQAMDEDPMALAEKNFRKVLYADDSYGHPVQGTRESLQRLKREDVVKFYRTYFLPGNAILSIVGDLNREELNSVVLPLFEKWPIGKVPNPGAKARQNEGPKTTSVDRKVAQASIVVGNGAVDRQNEDYYPLQVMSYILGGDFGSYLMEEVRVKKGLAYSVSSGVEAEKYGGSFQISLQTKNASAAESLSIVLRQIDRIRTELVSDADLNRAKSYLTGSFPMRFDSQTKLSSFLTLVEFYGLGLDYLKEYPPIINKITAADIQRVARQYLHPDKAILSVVADLKEAHVGDVVPGGSGK
jgi:zinc protease